MRIVSLCPSLTELVFDLGLGDDLVGITKYCIHPADGVAAVEKVGGTKDPDVARITALAPDVVLVNEEENRKEDAEALTAAGLRLASSFPKTAPETATMVRDYGRVLGVEGPAEAIAADIEARTAAVTARAAARGATRSFLYLIWRKPWMACGADSFPSALLEQAGGRNALAGDPALADERFPALEADAIRALDPDLVLLSSEPFPFEAKHADELAVATGLPVERFRLVDGEDLSWHGSRTPRGVDYAEDALWGPRG